MLFKTITLGMDGERGGCEDCFITKDTRVHGKNRNGDISLNYLKKESNFISLKLRFLNSKLGKITIVPHYFVVRIRLNASQQFVNKKALCLC